MRCHKCIASTFGRSDIERQITTHEDARSLAACSPLHCCSAARRGLLAQDMTGAGATFPAPIYAKWADAYNKATGARLNYQSVGSGAGIKQIHAKTVDFGASDMPLERRRARQGRA